MILPQCDIVLAVAGASALGRPLNEVCFRAEIAAELLGSPLNAELTPFSLAILLASEKGGRKAAAGRTFYAVLNQADEGQRHRLAEQTACILREIYGISCVLTHFEKEERA